MSHRVNKNAKEDKMFKINKINVFFLVLIFLVTILILTGTSLAAEYPERPITVVVPYGPGGSSDTGSRIVMKYVEKYIGQPIVIKNVAGAAGSVGSRGLLDSKPDGYTLLYNHLTLLTAYHTGTADFTWDSFTPICQISKFIEALTVHGDSKWDTVYDLVEDAKAHPGEIKWGLNVGAGLHFAYAEFTSATGTEFRIVPGGGDADQTTKLLGEHIDVATPWEGVAKQYYDVGELKCLGVMADERTLLLPDTLTLKEQGIDAVFMFEPWLFGPAGLSDDVVEILSQAVKQALDDPECREDLLKAGMYQAFLSQSELKDHLQEVDAKLYFLSMKADLLKRRK